MARRKLFFNISLLAIPWTWVTISCFVSVLLLAPILAENEIEETKVRRPWLTRGFTAVAATAAASLLFKDSGFTTAFYLAGSYLAVAFYYVLNPEFDPGTL